MRKGFFTLSFIASINICSFSQVYLDPEAPIDGRVEDLLSRMTLAEKVGQMAQAERGSVTNNDNVTTYFLGSVLSGGGSAPAVNTPEGWADMYDQLQAKALATRLGIPILYGIDAVHGHNTLYGTVIFPHNIGLGCTFNPELVKQAARITAIEVAATGLDWTFSPCVAVPQDERWGRTYEGFSESPDLVKLMSAAVVKGYQGDTLADSCSIIACAKHYVGDGGTTNGINTGNTEVDEATLRAIHLPGYIAAVNSGVATVMASFSSWNGQLMHGNSYLITDVLKGELGFNGFVVSDWNAIELLPGTWSERIASAVNAGIDMAMEPNNYRSYIETLIALVNSGDVTMERIDDAVRRILRVKFEMGLFEHPYANRSLLDSIGNDSHRKIARQCVRESMVLLKKRDDILPLSKENLRICVSGSSAHNVGNQCGGWTLTWAGLTGNIIPGTSIYEGLMQVAPDNTYIVSQDASGGNNADVGIVVIGETPYAESLGDRGSIDRILSEADINSVRTMKSHGIPVIVILVTGRPVNIQSILHFADVIIAAWLPGTEGGGIADILFGDFQPCGRLSYTWPVNNAQLPINIGDTEYSPLYPFGYGICTLDNSETGSIPEFYSAAVMPGGDKLELSFSKKMNLPVNTGKDFTITVSGNAYSIRSFSYPENDSFRLQLEMYPFIKSGEPVILTYTPGELSATDGGLAGEINDYNVFNYSTLTGDGIASNSPINNLIVFPNPAINSCIIHCTGFNTQRIHLDVFDASGQRVQGATASSGPGNDYILSTASFPPGLYLIKVCDDRLSSTIKLMVRRNKE